MYIWYPRFLIRSSSNCQFICCAFICSLWKLGILILFMQSIIHVEFASCSLKLSDHEEDRMSWCQNGKSGFEKRCSVSSNEIPKMLKQSKSRENRRLQCKWQLTRHFSRDTLASEFAADNLELTIQAMKIRVPVSFFPHCIMFHFWLRKTKVKCISQKVCIYNIYMAISFYYGCLNFLRSDGP